MEFCFLECVWWILSHCLRLLLWHWSDLRVLEEQLFFPMMRLRRVCDVRVILDVPDFLRNTVHLCVKRVQWKRLLGIT